MRKRIELLTIFFTLLLLFSSCENSESPNGEPFVILYTAGGKDYCQFYEQPDSNSVYCYAYITDGNDFVNVSNIYVNNIQCKNMTEEETLEGQYQGLITPYPAILPHNIHWVINGWQGNNYEITQTITNNLDFTNLHYLDTISANNDLNVLYSGGSNNGETIRVQMGFAELENFHFFDITEIPPNSEYETNVIDNGFFTIPSSVLSNFEKNRYYSICLTNSSASDEVINNHKIFKKSVIV